MWRTHWPPSAGRSGNGTGNSSVWRLLDPPGAKTEIRLPLSTPNPPDCPELTGAGGGGSGPRLHQLGWIPDSWFEWAPPATEADPQVYGE